jgi:hypothetical protein
MKRNALLLTLGLLLAGCGGGKEGKGPGTRPAASQPTTEAALPGVPGVLPADGMVREPAVAGLWYPREPQNLAKLVDMTLSMWVPRTAGKVRAVIVPHAGYDFSSVTAAAAYKEIMGQNVQTVIILAPSHTARFEGASIPEVEAYRTPLGLVRLSRKAVALAKVKPFIPAPRLEAQRPAWWTKASKQAPPVGQDTPHTWEHSLECQLPFLQWVLAGFELVPVVYGDVEPAKVAEALTLYLDDTTVLVASSDLSHHHREDVARSLDGWCVKAVQEMNLELMKQQEACGKGPILTVMHLAKERGWKPQVLDYRTSAQSPKGNPKDVVGYMAVAFTEGVEQKPQPLTAGEKKYLLKLARAVLTSVVNKQPLPRVDATAMSPRLLEPTGVFVTLNKDGELQGCIGHTMPVQRLFRAVIENAANAAVRDIRFPGGVTSEDLDKIVIDISVLTVPKPVYYNEPSDLLKLLRPRVDGVVLQVPVLVGNRATLASSVYLPAVWEKIPDPATFMDQLSLKARLPAHAWRQSSARVLLFQAEEFKETKE